MEVFGRYVKSFNEKEFRVEEKTIVDGGRARLTVIRSYGGVNFTSVPQEELGEEMFAASWAQLPTTINRSFDQIVQGVDGQRVWLGGKGPAAAAPVAPWRELPKRIGRSHTWPLGSPAVIVLGVIAVGWSLVMLRSRRSAFPPWLVIPLMVGLIASSVAVVVSDTGPWYIAPVVALLMVTASASRLKLPACTAYLLRGRPGRSPEVAAQRPEAPHPGAGGSMHSPPVVEPPVGTEREDGDQVKEGRGGEGFGLVAPLPSCSLPASYSPPASTAENGLVVDSAAGAAPAVLTPEPDQLQPATRRRRTWLLWTLGLGAVLAAAVVVSMDRYERRQARLRAESACYYYRMARDSPPQVSDTLLFAARNHAMWAAKGDGKYKPLLSGLTAMEDGNPQAPDIESVRSTCDT